MRLTFTTAVVAAVWSLASVVTPAQAAPREQRIDTCGQQILGDAYLAKDLTCTVGFTIDAKDGAEQRGTVDLRGHRLRGRGAGTAFHVDDLLRYPTVTIENGRIDGWSTGVWVRQGIVNGRDLLIDHNTVGIDCQGGCGDFRRTVVARNDVGTRQVRSTLVMVDDQVVGNDIGSQIGQDSERWSGADGVFRRVYYRGNRIGIDLEPQSLLDLTQSKFTANGTGVFGSIPRLVKGYTAFISSSRFSRNGEGIHLTPDPKWDQAYLGSVVAVDNHRYGIFAPGAHDAGGNRAARNGHGSRCTGVSCAAP